MSNPSKPKQAEASTKAKPHIFIPPEDRKTSKSGIFSLSIAVITMLGYIILASLGTSMIEPYLTPDGTIVPPQEALEKMSVLAAVFIVILVLNLAGLILGIIGSMNKNSKRAIAVVGSIINGVVLFTILSMFVFVLNG
ncbi:hypothetical protein E6C60_2908 [Paenibacillus algicola]|uniref:Uncharacterized protein n=1 Tax=Paenibacillus algicola TaxID=2565926 RepID=A0A4P8XSJ5_9BACL|nr:hypothetical protein [Paenibacillus algicola]QCT03619.1 hypothetical protein E6C60_2908 [Paenibacillus algicola]